MFMLLISPAWVPATPPGEREVPGTGKTARVSHAVSRRKQESHSLLVPGWQAARGERRGISTPTAAVVPALPRLLLRAASRDVLLDMNNLGDGRVIIGSYTVRGFTRGQSRNDAE